jgi:uncharacterized protein (TIGR00297 family)
MGAFLCLSANRDATGESAREPHSVSAHAHALRPATHRSSMLTSTAAFRARVSAHPKTARRGGLVHPRGAMPARRVVQSSAGNKHASRCRAATLGGPTALAPADAPRRSARLRASAGDAADAADAADSTDPSLPSGPDSISDSAFAGGCETVGDAVALIKAELFAPSPKKRGSRRTLLLALIALVAIHVRDPGWGIWNTIRVAGSLALGGGLALKGLKSGSLDASGAASAALVGWGTLYAGVRFGVTLGVFFFASSAMTRVGSAVKATVDEHHVKGKEGGARDWVQVCANGLVPTFLAMGYAFATGGPEHLLGVTNAFETPLAAAFIGYYACCGGDTWASELGVLSKTPPRLITSPGTVVKPGTNGGVTPLGFVASGAGGLAVGFAFYLGGLLVPLVTGRFELLCRFATQWPILVIGLGAGLVGSLVDSVLGATIQFSGYCSRRKRMVSAPGPTVRRVSGVNFLSNSMVNFVSAVLCATVLYFGTIAAGLPRP